LIDLFLVLVDHALGRRAFGRGFEAGGRCGVGRFLLGDLRADQDRHEDDHQHGEEREHAQQNPEVVLGERLLVHFHRIVSRSGNADHPVKAGCDLLGILRVDAERFAPDEHDDEFMADPAGRVLAAGGGFPPAPAAGPATPAGPTRPPSPPMAEGPPFGGATPIGPKLPKPPPFGPPAPPGPPAPLVLAPAVKGCQPERDELPPAPPSPAGLPAAGPPLPSPPIGPIGPIENPPSPAPPPITSLKREWLMCWNMPAAGPSLPRSNTGTRG